MGNRTQIQERFTLIFWFFVFLSVFALLDILYLMVFQRDKYKEIQITVKPGNIEAKRGNIYDDKGNLLVTSAYKYELRFDPLTEYLRKDENFYGALDSLTTGLSDILGNTPEYYKNKFIEARKNHNRSLLFATNVSYLQLQKIKKLPLFRLRSYKGGLIVKKQIYRKMLNNDLARRTIGIRGKNGFFGIEGMATSLQGSDGMAKFQTMKSGYKKAVHIFQNPDPGKDIVTTIDLDLQDIVDKALREQLINLDADFGVAILMEVKTGKIRAVANLSKVDEGKYAEINNLAATELYEPGSVMKLASFICDFEEDNNLTLNTEVNTEGGIWHISNDFAITDYNYNPQKGTGGFGIIPVQRVFEVSSNTGTAKLAWNTFKNKPEKFTRKYSEFWFDKSLDLGFANEPMPRFSHPDERGWSGVSLAQLAIGYEINVTPYHIITLYNAVANNSKMVKPIFIEKEMKDGIVTKEYKPYVINSAICSQKTLNYCKTMLEGVVENGTGKHYVKSDLVKIAGKSGTAQINQGGRYNFEQLNTTFVAYFPADKPKYTLLVWINKPKIHKSGSAAAGSVVKKIAEEIYAIDYQMHDKQYVVNRIKHGYITPFVSKGFDFSTYPLLEKINLPFKANGKKLVSASVVNDTLVFRTIKVKRSKMPDVRGMNLQDALFMLGNMGLKVNFKGSGFVKKQSLPAGKDIKRGQGVTLTLSMS